MSDIDAILAHFRRCGGGDLDVEGQYERARLELAALREEVGRLRAALEKIARMVYPQEIVKDTLPAGYGISAEEVGADGPWYGLGPGRKTVFWIFPPLGGHAAANSISSGSDAPLALLQAAQAVWTLSRVWCPPRETGMM